MDKLKIKGNLTPRFINSKLGPFLESLTSLQHNIDEMRHVPPSAVQILEISGEGTSSEGQKAMERQSRPRTDVEWRQIKQALKLVRETCDEFIEEGEPESPTLREAKLNLAYYCAVLGAQLFGDFANRDSETSEWLRLLTLDKLGDLPDVRAAWTPSSVNSSQYLEKLLRMLQKEESSDPNLIRLLRGQK